MWLIIRIDCDEEAKPLFFGEEEWNQFYIKGYEEDPNGAKVLEKLSKIWRRNHQMKGYNSKSNYGIEWIGVYAKNEVM